MRIYPRGTVYYNKEKAFNGINLISTAKDGALLTSMCGDELARYELNPMPAKMFSNGNIISATEFRTSDFGVSDGISLVEIEKNGDVCWNFSRNKFIKDRGYKEKWMARCHSDFQRKGHSLDYCHSDEKLHTSKTLMLTHENVFVKAISDKELLDDVILEVDDGGNILWKFSFSEHFDDLNFSEEAKNVIYRNPNLRITESPIGNYLDVTSISYLGDNKWFDMGDSRFHPDNILFTARAANITGIIDRKKNKIVYTLGPDLDRFKKFPPIIGSAFASLIPKGLDGEGNLLIFDNGGSCGYGAATIFAPQGLFPFVRGYSRILEINPITLNINWKVDPRDFGYSIPLNGYKFYSPYGGNLERLPNGNTLVTLTTEGMVIEITRDKEIVWQWVSPYRRDTENMLNNNLIYRVYRYPYSYWGIESYPEREIEKVDQSYFQLEGAGKFLEATPIKVKGAELNKDIDPLSQESESIKELRQSKEIYRRNLSRIKTISSYDFYEKTDNLTGLVIFGAIRCTHCGPLLELVTDLLEDEFQGVNCYYLDIDTNSDIAKDLNVGSIPLVNFYKSGEVVYSFTGENTYDNIADAIDKYVI